VDDVLLNDRLAETDPLERARKRALVDRDYARDLELLAGVLTGDGEPRPERPRPVTDVSWEFG
jgi:hypothetical protein